MVKKWLRKWLGIERLEDRLDRNTHRVRELADGEVTIIDALPSLSEELRDARSTANAIGRGGAFVNIL